MRYQQYPLGDGKLHYIKDTILDNTQLFCPPVVYPSTNQSSTQPDVIQETSKSTSVEDCQIKDTSKHLDEPSSFDFLSNGTEIIVSPKFMILKNFYQSKYNIYARGN